MFQSTLADHTWAPGEIDRVLQAAVPTLRLAPNINRKGIRALHKQTERLSLKHRFAVFSYVASRIWTGPLSEHEKGILQENIEWMDRWTWYHGGAPGLTAGDLLLPAAETGADPRQIGGTIPNRTEAVFITPIEAIAEAYAGRADGHVYVVEPIGEITADAIDLRARVLMKPWLDMDIECFCCPSARIVDRI